MGVIVRGSPNVVKNGLAETNEKRRSCGSVEASGGPFLRTILLGVLGIAILLGGRVLLGEPLRGVADHGDFHRILTPAGLEPVGDTTGERHNYVHRSYEITHAQPDRGTSSGAWLAFLAARVPGPFVDGTRVDVRRFGLAHGLVAVAFLAIGIVRRVPPSRLVAVAFVVAAPEVLLSWNGLHPDVAATLGLVGIAIGLLDGRRDRVGRQLASASLVVGALLVGFSSRSHAFVPILVAASILLVDRTRRILATGIAMIGILAIGHFEFGTGPRFESINRYHAVYRGLAEVADDREAVLREFGLDPGSRRFVGKSRFRVDPGPDVERALGRMSRAELAWNYLIRPVAIVRAGGRVARTLADPRPPLGGSHERTTPERAPSPPSRGVNLRALRTGSGVLGGVIAVLVGAVAALAATRRSPAHARVRDTTFLAFTLLLALTEPVAAILGDGTFSLRRHLLLTSMTLDLCFGVLLLTAGELLIDRRRVRVEVPVASSPE